MSFYIGNKVQPPEHYHANFLLSLIFDSAILKGDFADTDLFLDALGVDQKNATSTPIEVVLADYQVERKAHWALLKNEDIRMSLLHGAEVIQRYIAEVTAVIYSLMNTLPYNWEHRTQCMGEIMDISFNMAGISNPEAIDGSDLNPYNFRDLNTKAALEWVTLHQRKNTVFESFYRDLQSADRSLRDQINPSASLRYPLMESSFSKVCDEFGGQFKTHLSCVLALSEKVLSGVNQKLKEVDLSSNQSLLNICENTSNLYQSVCNIADSLSPNGGVYEMHQNNGHGEGWSFMARSDACKSYPVPQSQVWGTANSATQEPQQAKREIPFVEFLRSGGMSVASQINKDEVSYKITRVSSV